MSAITPVSLKNAVMASFMGVEPSCAPKYNESIDVLLPVLEKLADITEYPEELDGYTYFKIENGDIKYDLSNGINGLYDDVFSYLGFILKQSNESPYSGDFHFTKGSFFDLVLSEFNTIIEKYFTAELPDNLLEMSKSQFEYWVADNYLGDFTGLSNKLMSDASDVRLTISEAMYAYFVLDRSIYIKWDDKTTSVISADGTSYFIMSLIEGFFFNSGFFLE